MDDFRTTPRYTTVIFDLGDVLFIWSPSTTISRVPPKTLRAILRSVHWFEYEKGNLGEELVYTLVAKEHGLAFLDVKAAFQAARESLQCNPMIMEVIHDLKVAGISVYAMSNISAPDWAVLSNTISKESWSMFDHVFTSAEAHERKPNIGFYKHVIERSGIDPTRTVFVDDKLENVFTARSFGMHGIVFDNENEVVRQLKNICGDPIARGNEYLTTFKRRHISKLADNTALWENFSQLLILEATGDKSLVEYTEHTGQFNFFRGPQAQFPNDLDTTAIGLSICDHVGGQMKLHTMNEMLEYINADGIIQVYFDHSRPRIDPVVCVNVLTLFYQQKRGHELPETLAWVIQILENRAYTSGTYYYATGDHFLFFLSRLLQQSDELYQRLKQLFVERISEQIGNSGDALSLACRIIAASTVGIADHTDLKTLLSLQREDGSWRTGWFYKYGSTGALVGNDGLTTAFAIRAIHEVHKIRL